MAESVALKRKQNINIPGNLNVGGTLSGVTHSMVGAVGGDGSISLLIQDVIANRPAYGNTGVWFYAEDTGDLYRDTGSGWNLILTVSHQNLDGAGVKTHSEIDVHINNLDNPHQVDTDIINALNKTGGVMTGPITMPDDPSQAMQVATKQYVDAVVSGLDIRGSMRVATTTNETDIDLDLAPLVIDGVTLVVGDRVLIKNNAYHSSLGEISSDASAVNNGLYEVSIISDTSLSLVRTEDANEDSEITGGLFTFVTEGSVNQNSGFVLVSNDPIIVDADAQYYTQFSGAGQVIAGDSIYKTGNEIGLDRPAAVTNLSLVENGSAVDITFDLPADRSNINNYLIYRSIEDHLNYRLIGSIKDSSVAGSFVTFTDNTYERNNILNYIIVATNNGVCSDILTGSITPINLVADPANLKVVADTHSYHISYDLPNDRRLDYVRVTVDSALDIANLAEGNGTVIYEGNSDDIVYEIPEENMEKYHKFWVYVFTKS